ncbi:mycothiol conjugate amidase Mca [Corynebacterium sp. sy039]|uniref:mycothiol conjugate amidase Mca n=1 Tax=Corynebacterium sp. sy039 TaxID=2599641 RepID=UPI0011B55160|nr:mycothiol conjugate amidase Mca [Corynebacterium sp. sy039]QDZ42285.1 mycothiol conjugate amidase Mca [Corynebacterium sp. sy039]
MKRRLLAIHAHPDDESSKGAATMARYSAEGHRVKVITCTGGERGDILNPAMDTVENAHNIAAIRRQEMEKAAAALGVEHMWLGYVDSGLPEGQPLPELPSGCFALADTAEIVEKLVREIRLFRPHVIITYDENGGYPHPDHLKVHEVSLLAWEKAGDPHYLPECEPWTPLKLYYTHGFIRERIELLHTSLVNDGAQSPFAEILAQWPQDGADIMARVTTRVAAAAFFDKRDAALLAHATQIDPEGMFLAVPTDKQRLLWPTEEFELARTRVPVTMPENDLFHGLVDTTE